MKTNLVKSGKARLFYEGRIPDCDRNSTHNRTFANKALTLVSNVCPLLP